MTAAYGLEPPAGVGVPLSVKVPSLATLKIEIVLARELPRREISSTEQGQAGRREVLPLAASALPW